MLNTIRDQIHKFFFQESTVSFSTDLQNAWIRTNRGTTMITFPHDGYLTAHQFLRERYPEDNGK